MKLNPLGPIVVVGHWSLGMHAFNSGNFLIKIYFKFK